MEPRSPGKQAAVVASRPVEEQAPELAASLRAMHERAHRDWMQFLVPDRGSHAGYSHLRNVEHNLDKMLPGKMKLLLNPGEIFLLLSAALFHDIGRVYPEPKGLERFCWCTSPCGEKSCANWHWVHHFRSRCLIEDHGLELGLPDEKIRDYCALLVYCHGLDGPPDLTTAPRPNDSCIVRQEEADRATKKCSFHQASLEPYGKLRIPMLAALLRIADEAENHWTRSYGDMWINEFEKELRKRLKPAKHAKSEKIIAEALVKSFRSKIEDIEFSHGGQCIVVYVELPKKDTDAEKLRSKDTDAEKLRSYETSARKLQQVLDAWNSELEPLGEGFKRVFFKMGGKLQEIDPNPNRGKLTLHEVFEGRYAFLPGKTSPDPDYSQRTRQLASAMIILSQATMGFASFPLGTLEAQVGRSLDPLDFWLLERMAEWDHQAIQFNPDSKILKIDPHLIEDIRQSFVKPAATAALTARGEHARK